jgi:hypothetical protein
VPTSNMQRYAAMRTSTLAALFVFLPTLVMAQSLGDQDSSGRFDGMPPGTDRYRDDNNSGSFSIPLETSTADGVREPRTTFTTCVHPLKSSRSALPAGPDRVACR